jgi:hypothetical protein
MFYRSGLLLPVLSISYSIAPFSLSLPLFFSTPGAALEGEEILLLFFFHYITHTFFPTLGIQ